MNKDKKTYIELVYDQKDFKVYINKMYLDNLIILIIYFDMTRSLNKFNL